MLSSLSLLLVLIPTARPEAAIAQPATKLPITGLAPSRYVDGLCVYSYPVSTRSEECQKHCDQAFGYYYSYVWMEAARSFETALQHDPDCAYAWLGLHRSLEKWGKTTARPNSYLGLAGGLGQPTLPERLTRAPHDYALEMAKKLLPRANHRESLLITSRLQEKGMLPGVAPDERKKKAQETLDELLALYEDDEEGWYYRAQLAGSGTSPPSAGSNASIVFYKALLRLNPLHPGANHELVHIYENVRRPALGWPYAENYMKSTPRIAHPFHMQAHLAMRVGKWQNTSNWSWHAVQLEKAYHQELGVDPRDDHQFRHHMEILTRSLIHDGRFDEAKIIQKEAIGYKYWFRPEWFRMNVTEGDWSAAEKIIADMRKQERQDKTTTAYFSAVLALEKGDLGRARAEADVLRQTTGKKSDRRHELRVNEIMGRIACATGDATGGIKLLRRTIDKTKDDYAHHAWGGGAYFMEVWGDSALAAGVVSEAEEAYQEALAHDGGSIRGALGMWALCDRLGRTDEAARYLKLAKRCWSQAKLETFERLKASYENKAKSIATSSLTANR